MRASLRVFAAILAALATYLFVYWRLSFLLGIGTREPRALRLMVAVAGAIAVALFVARATRATALGPIRSILLGAILVGSIGLLAGFVGPLLAGGNLPLLGLFVTGPLGALIGAIGGLIYWWTHRSDSTKTFAG